MAERAQAEVEGDKAEEDGDTEECVAGAVRQLDAAQLRPAGNCGDTREPGGKAEERPNEPPYSRLGVITLWLPP